METTKLDLLLLRLNYYKNTNPDLGLDHFDIGRHTYCNLIFFYDNKHNNDKHVKHGYHIFEVRGFTSKQDEINVTAVNWTMVGGTCTLSISHKNIELFKILEDEPTLQVLYGQ